MPNYEQRKTGKIVEYYPLRQAGYIFLEESDRMIQFNCKHVRSDQLRKALCQAPHFGTTDVCLRLAVPVVFTLYEENLLTRAGRIDLEAGATINADLTRPLTGYIHFFGTDKKGGSPYGWINPEPNNANNRFSSRFSIDAVIDPLLAQYLQEHPAEDRSFWMKKRIKVQYWCVDEQHMHLSAWDVNLTDAEIRSILMREAHNLNYTRVPNKPKRIEVAPLRREVPADYEDLPLPLPPITREEQQKLLEFQEEAVRVCANTPAIRDRIPDFWKMVVRGGKQALLESFCQEDGLSRTKIAYILEAACSYLDHDLANVLRCCKNAQSFRFGMRLAAENEAYGIAQRMAEEILDDMQEETLLTLCQSAFHTGNAEMFCGLFAEYLEGAAEDESLMDVCYILAECAQVLLEQKEISTDGMDERMMLQAVSDAYCTPLASLDALILALKEAQDAETATPEEEAAQSPAAQDTPEQPQILKASFEELKEQFTNHFRTEGKYRLPVPQRDGGMIAVLDQLLASDAPDIGEYRMPLLVRIALDPQSAAPAIQRYLDQLTEALQAKRRPAQKDRRWRMFKAIEEFIQTGAGMEKALQEAQRDDERMLLNYLVERRGAV